VERRKISLLELKIDSLFFHLPVTTPVEHCCLDSVKMMTYEWKGFERKWPWPDGGTIAVFAWRDETWQSGYSVS
jgi:hypothetical protein